MVNAANTFNAWMPHLRQYAQNSDTNIFSNTPNRGGQSPPNAHGDEEMKPQIVYMPDYATRTADLRSHGYTAAVAHEVIYWQLWREIN